jgi:hypothetical protein
MGTKSGKGFLAVAAGEIERARLVVLAIDQTMAALRETGELDWQEQIETLTRLREETIARVHEIDPSIEFDNPAPN